MPDLGFRVWALGILAFFVQGLGFRDSDFVRFGFGLYRDSEFWVRGLGILDLRFRVRDFGF